MKKILVIFTAVLILLCTTACGNGEESKKETSSSTTEQEIEINVNDILMSMRETQVGFPQYTTASSHDENGNVIEGWEDIFSLSLYEDFDVSKVKSYAIAYSTAQTADEITIVELNSKNDAEEMKKQMKTRVSDRIKLFETYGPEEVPKLENAEIISKGNVCVLLICDVPEKAAEVLEENL